MISLSLLMFIEQMEDEMASQHIQRLVARNKRAFCVN